MTAEAQAKPDHCPWCGTDREMVWRPVDGTWACWRCVVELDMEEVVADRR